MLRGRITRFVSSITHFNVYHQSTRHFNKGPLINIGKILVPNRGEVACRIIDTCRQLRIPTVAVYSTVDSESVHVKSADESICIGGPHPSESYLNVNNILDAVKVTGASAVFPGYGFLSNNYDFVRVLENNNIKFIGPTPSSMQKMSDSNEALTIAENVNIKTLPRFTGEIGSEKEFNQIVEKIGLPVMIKGQRISIARTESEASKEFKKIKKSNENMDIEIEKYIENPRIIEMHLLRDAYGNAIHLNEVETSIQRRNQTFIEEAPSTYVKPKIRSELARKTLALAETIEYESAGSVSFLIDEREVPNELYFQNMNTGLTPGHHLIEAITRVDIIEQMIRIAAGEQLSISQDQIQIGGSAIGCRIHAEDPANDYFPSSGKISGYEEPSIIEDDVRIESGIAEGSIVPPYYDTLLSKILTIKDDRILAIDLMKSALDTYFINGVNHNLSFLRSIMDNSRFMNGDLSCNFVQEEYPNGFQLELSEKDRNNLLALAVLVFYEDAHRQTVGDDFQPAEMVVLNYEGQEYVGKFDAESRVVALYGDNMDPTKVEVNYEWKFGASNIESMLNSELTAAKILDTTYNGYKIYFNCGTHFVKAQTEIQNSLEVHMLPKKTVDKMKIISPIRGTIDSVHVQIADKVKVGQPLFDIETMQSKHTVRAKKDCIISNIFIKAGDTVVENDILLQLQ